MFAVSERGRFARSPADHNRVYFVRDLKFYKFSVTFVIYFTVPERCYDSRRRPRKNFSAHIKISLQKLFVCDIIYIKFYHVFLFMSNINL
jgi:hypothetical protein